MISKELLSNVLKVDLPEYLKLFGNTDITFTNGDSMVSINIHELAHKCKEWAFKYGKFQIYSGRFSDCCGRNCIATVKWNEGMWRSIDFTEAEEHEAIFKACQWILDNKETK